MVGLILDLVRYSGKAKTFFTLAMYATALIVSLSPIVLSTGISPARTLVAYPVFFAILGSRSVLITNRHRFPVWLLVGLSVFVSIWISVSLFYSDSIARKRDDLIAIQLAERIIPVTLQSSGTPHPFIVVGSLPAKQDSVLKRVEVFGASMFEQDGGSSGRIAMYLQLWGVAGLSPKSITEIEPFIAEVDALPIWPEPGSVAVLHGYLIVKLSPISDSRPPDLVRLTPT